jgi:uncharacterized protein
MRRVLALLALLGGCAGVGPQHDKVVYHLSEGLPQASNALRNIGNHLEVNPNARIVVVSHARGVDTLRNRKLAKDQFIADTTYVPSGVAEVTRLQQREGFAYLKP